MSTEDRRVVVIGTGPAGAAAAWTLQRAGIAVTVLEAGQETAAHGLTVRAPGFTFAHLHSSRLPYPPDIRADPHGPPQWFHDLSPGGLTNHWSCAVPRFAPADFHDGDPLGDELRWPLRYDDLRQDYPAMERLLSIGGAGEEVTNLPANEVRHRIRLSRDWTGLVAKAAARGHGLTALPKAYGSDWMVTRGATPFNSYLRVVRPLRRSSRFEVIFGARVTRLEWSKQKGEVTRVHYADDLGNEHSIATAVVVVAAGAVSSARLLLESRSDEFPQGLGNQHGNLGRYLHDHPLGKLSVEVSRHISIHPPAYLTRGPYGESPPLRGVASILWSGSSTRVRSWLRLHPDKADCIGFSLFGTMTPRKSMGIALQPGDSGKVSLQLSFEEDVLREMDKARDRVLQILDDEGLKPKVREWFVERPGWSVHLGGTTRMHGSPEHGVVDGFCRVHGVPNVRVVDSGVFTTGPEKNPSLTAMAIASRACRQLAEALRRG